MILDLLNSIIRRIGARFVLLDAALPGPAESITILFMILIPIAVIVALIVIIFRWRKRKLAEKAAAAALEAMKAAEESGKTE
ncbi:MAG: hypothetical protein IKX47_02025 [Oscillospiraceae bacterium]|nr:hypothetical protein [Oscillospiraceae bacterium]